MLSEPRRPRPRHTDDLETGRLAEKISLSFRPARQPLFHRCNRPQVHLGLEKTGFHAVVVTNRQGYNL